MTDIWYGNELWGYYSGVTECSSLLECYAVWIQTVASQHGVTCQTTWNV